MSGELIDDPFPERKRQLYGAVVIVVGISVLAYVALVHLTELETGSVSHRAIWKSILENVLGGTFGAVVLALGYRFAVSYLDSPDRVVEVKSNAITERLQANARRTRSYVFIGNTATFVVASVIPILLSRIGVQRQHRSITMFLIDPCSAAAVRSYTEFKNTVAIKDSMSTAHRNERWMFAHPTPKLETEDGVIGKLLAAVYLAALGARQQGFTASIFFRASYTPFRVDMSDVEAVLTQESRKDSAVAFSSEGHFYSWYQKECDSLMAQATLSLSFGPGCTMTLGLAAPENGAAAVRASLINYLQSVPHLQPLTTKPLALDVAVANILSPKSAYD